jgi:ABC-2 type transport system permease protein
MMLNNVVLKTLRDKRRALLGWAIALTGFAFLFTLYWPYIRDMPSIVQLLQAYPEALIKIFVGGDISKFNLVPESFLNAELFFLWVPLVLMLFAVTFGSDAVAGEEERGTLDLLLANPVPRSGIVIEKFIALSISSAILGVTLWFALMAGSMISDMGISPVRLAEVIFSAVLLGLVFGSLSLALGCVGLKPGMSTGVGATLGVASYLVNALAPVFKEIQPYQKFSPFYYYIQADPLVNGLNLGDVMVLVALIVVTFVIALAAFQHRDIGV